MVKILPLFSFLLLCITHIAGQDSISFIVEGNILDIERRFPIEGAQIIVTGASGHSFKTISNQFGHYTLEVTTSDPLGYFLIEVEPIDHYSTSRKFALNGNFRLCLDFELEPPITCIDTWFPKHFTFAFNSSILNMEDSMAIVLRFSNPELKEILQLYSYNIVVRRSTEECDDTALKRGNTIRKLLEQMGIDSEHITIENKSTNDFFYCNYCEGCIYEYLIGQGINVTQELISKTSDPEKKEEYESMRRIAQIEMKKLE